MAMDLEMDEGHEGEGDIETLDSRLLILDSGVWILSPQLILLFTVNANTKPVACNQSIFRYYCPTKITLPYQHRMKKILWVAIVSLHIGFLNFVDARGWELPGIDIVTRAERGANESWKWADSGFYDWAIADNENFKARLEGIGVDR